MRIRIFRAASLVEAMAQVRDELGLDALILATDSRGGLVEVTAALEPEDEPELPGGMIAAEPRGVLSAEPRGRTVAEPPDVPVAHGRASDPLFRHNLPPALLSALREGPLEAACSRLFRFSRLPLDADGAPLLLVGPPGAGKTLTVAKLATRLVMEGHRPLVITADEQRAGAIEQLAAFTRLLGLTLIAAGRPETLARALARRETLSPVLIDAPGLDLSDPAHDALQGELMAASGARPVLVLPAGLDPLEAIEIAQAQARHGVRLMIPTRIDRAGRLGGILAACHGAELALTEAGVGTDVADGLKRLTPVTLAAHLAASTRPRGGSPPAPSPPQPEAWHPDSGVLSRHIAAQAGSHHPSARKNDP